MTLEKKVRVKFDLEPADMAEVVANASADEQVAFFNALRYHTDKFDWERQCAYIRASLDNMENGFIVRRRIHGHLRVLTDMLEEEID